MALILASNEVVSVFCCNEECLVAFNSKEKRFFTDLPLSVELLDGTEVKVETVEEASVLLGACGACGSEDLDHDGKVAVWQAQADALARHRTTKSFWRLLSKDQQAKSAWRAIMHGRDRAEVEAMSDDELVDRVELTRKHMERPRWRAGDPVYDAQMHHVLIPELLRRLSTMRAEEDAEDGEL